MRYSFSINDSAESKWVGFSMHTDREYAAEAWIRDQVLGYLNKLGAEGWRATYQGTSSEWPVGLHFLVRERSDEGTG